MRGESLRRIARLAEAVRSGPRLLPARPARAQRAGKMRIQFQKVARAAFGGSVQRLPQQRAEHRQVVLQVVDRPGWIIRRRPVQRSLRFAPRLRLQFLELRDASPGGTLYVKCVEGGYALACLGNLQPGIGNVNTLARGRNRQAQLEALSGYPVVLQSKLRTELPPQFIQQKRIFADSPRKDALGESGHEDDLE